MNPPPRISRGLRFVVGCAGFALLSPQPAEAQLLARLSVHLEGGFSGMLARPQSDEYGTGFYGSARPGLRIAGPFGVHLVADTHRWESRVNGLDKGVATQVGAGLTLAPWLAGSAGRVLAQVEAGVGITGLGEPQVGRFYLGAGLGYMLPIVGVFELGPMGRYGRIFDGEGEGPFDPTRSTSPTGAASFWSLGLSVGLRAPEPRAPSLGPVDLDRDGVLDPEDVCPTVPSGEHPDRVRRGCPAGDQDHDTVYDPEDPCPTVPSGEHPDRVRRGCPAGDEDHDAITDDVDRCPELPEDRDNHEDTDGCPDPDNDADTLPDVSDRCPDQPESRNDFEDTDGCPDEAPPRAEVVADRIFVNQRVFFAFDRSEIEARSFPLLDQVVTLLTQHPELQRIRIEGHTDEQGGPDHNLPLSRDRARAVVTYLTRHGINRRRMESEGYGSTRPLVPENTEEAHAQNRRVDFIILAGAPQAGGAAPRTRRHGSPHRP